MSSYTLSLYPCVLVACGHLTRLLWNVATKVCVEVFCVGESACPPVSLNTFHYAAPDQRGGYQQKQGYQRGGYEHVKSFIHLFILLTRFSLISTFTNECGGNSPSGCSKARFTFSCSLSRSFLTTSKQLQCLDMNRKCRMYDFWSSISPSLSVLCHCYRSERWLPAETELPARRIQEPEPELILIPVRPVQTRLHSRTRLQVPLLIQPPTPDLFQYISLALCFAVL